MYAANETSTPFPRSWPSNSGVQIASTAVPGLHLAGESQLGSSNPIGNEKNSESIHTQRLPASCSSIGKANLTGLLQSGLRTGIMKLKYRAEEIFRGGDLIFTSDRNLGARNVEMDYDVRANQPAVVQTRCRWIIGDVTEVLDRNTWKLGKIAKMLKNNYFVIRLADCIQLKEFHISSLRVPAAPHTNQYSAADKKSEALNLKTKLAPRGQIPPHAALPGRSNKKRKSTADKSFHPRKRSSQPENASKACVLQYRPQQFIGEETECSVASCSINDPASFTNANNPQSFCFPDDAMSACPCTSGMEDDDVAGDISSSDADEPAIAAVHELELEAYQSTMRALYASGPLTWEQESLLTNLRLSLNISNEEHLLQLRRLLSSR
uniref:ENT domain-containing protein n=1 Tax=Leersia perrieri TaxID=77586 RepID=A0A0D9W048_9ORYZ